MTEQPQNSQSEIRNPNSEIVFDNVSKFYGEILGVNRVTLSIPPGITSLVGPNGAGKTTLMNLMTGLLRRRAALSTSWASRQIDLSSYFGSWVTARNSIRFRAD